ncbi:MAG: PilZ domain-containing protein [Candidatus Zixiibacteriota bacterium]|nr:MAG: PilZ domain-containing protein [candidate division Zixibacteria bacterium]
MDGKRKFKRRYANSFFGVYLKDTDEFVGCLVDMTVAGLMLETMSAMETDTLFEFRMDLPVEVEGSKDITFRAKSIWCKPAKDRGQYATGFEIQDVSEPELKKIMLLLDGPLFDDVDGMVRVNLSKIQLPLT